MSLTILKVGRFPMPEELKQSLMQYGELFVDSALSDEERVKVRERTSIIVASGSSEFTYDDYKTTPNLKAIVCFSVGYDKINIQGAIDNGVIVTHTPNVLNDDVANTALMLTLATTRELVNHHNYVENGEWGKSPIGTTVSIGGKKMGIVGLGRIGKEIATRAAAFKMTIGYHGRHKQDVPYEYFDNLLDLAKWADVLMLACPASSENYHMINDEVLAALGPQGYLINIARGSIVDTEALIRALDAKTIAGAGLDVYEHEPKVEDELKHRVNVVLLPHAGSATNETRKAMGDLVMENLKLILDGKDPKTPVPGTFPPKAK